MYYYHFIFVFECLKFFFLGVSLSLVMSECSLSGRGQGHVSNFYIVDLENFVTASRQYTGDIHNSSVVCLFIHFCTFLHRYLYLLNGCTQGL